MEIPNKLCLRDPTLLLLFVQISILCEISSCLGLSSDIPAKLLSLIMWVSFIAKGKFVNVLVLLRF